MHRLRRFMILFRCLAGVLALATLGAAPLSASHQSLLDEALAGAYGRPDVQFVEMRFSSCVENQWAGVRRLAFFDATGVEVGEFVVPANPQADCNVFSQSVLFGTQAFADLPSTPEPDFLIPPLLVPGSGKVCFQSVPAGSVNQCLSYGHFTGVTGQASSFNAPGLSSLGTCSLRRVAFFNDFGNINFNEDFALTTPAPRNGAGVTGGVVVPPRFSDVPDGSPFRPFVEALFNAGITGGCGNGGFCPTALVSRDQMAVLLLRAAEGAAFQPPACTSPMFNDVPCSSPFAPWINELAARGISSGCGGGNFCPGAPVTREQMAVFLLLAAEGPGFSPPACNGPTFNDVPCSSPFAPWVNELAARGISSGCGGGSFCPQGSVTREQMAVFLSTAFALPVPSEGCAAVPLPPDDHGNTLGTATPIPLGQAITPGTIELSGDVDVFSIPVTTGEPIIVETLGDDPQMLSSLEIVSANGTLLAFGSRGETGATARAFFVAPSSPVFARVLHSTSGTGSYGIRARPAEDDHGATGATATPLVPAASVLGEAAGDDADLFSFQAAAGQIFVVEVQGLQSANDLELTLLGPGLDVFRQFEFLFGFETERLTLVAQTSGTYFVDIRNFSSSGFGRYLVTLLGPIVDDHGNTAAQATPVPPNAGPVAGNHQYEGDADFFSLHANAGEAYRLTLVPTGSGNFPEMALWGPDGATFLGGFDDDLVLVAVETGTHFAQVAQVFSDTFGAYELTVTGPLADDHGNLAATATPFTPGDPALEAELEFENDRDFFSFHAEMGETVLLKAIGFDLVLTVLAPDGSTFLADASSFTEGSTARILFTAPAEGTYFARVAGFFSDIVGPYTLSMNRVPDDHGGLPSTATLLTVGAPPVAGVFEVGGDVDLFAFPAAAGSALVIETSQLAAGADTVIEIVDENGFQLARDDDGGGGLASRVLFTAPTTDLYFARVRHFSGGTGSYAVAVRVP